MVVSFQPSSFDFSVAHGWVALSFAKHPLAQVSVKAPSTVFLFYLSASFFSTTFKVSSSSSTLSTRVTQEYFLYPCIYSLFSPNILFWVILFNSRHQMSFSQTSWSSLLWYSAAYSRCTLWCVIIFVLIRLNEWCFRRSSNLFSPSHAAPHLQFDFSILYLFLQLAQALNFTFIFHFLAHPKFNPVASLVSTTSQPYLRYDHFSPSPLLLAQHEPPLHLPGLSDCLFFPPRVPSLIAATVTFQRTNQVWLLLLKTPQQLRATLRT